jgi:hypothetical protein
MVYNSPKVHFHCISSIGLQRGIQGTQTTRHAGVLPRVYVQLSRDVNNVLLDHICSGFCDAAHAV